MVAVAAVGANEAEDEGVKYPYGPEAYSPGDRIGGENADGAALAGQSVPLSRLSAVGIDPRREEMAVELSLPEDTVDGGRRYRLK